VAGWRLGGGRWRWAGGGWRVAVGGVGGWRWAVGGGGGQRWRGEWWAAFRTAAPAAVIGSMYQDTSQTDHDHPMRPVDIRRAILGTFLRADRPLSLTEVIDLLAAEGLLVSRGKVSDVMQHQVRSGRAQIVSRGVFRLDSSEFSEASRRRCLNWRAAKAWRERLYARYLRAYGESAPVARLDRQQPA